jgi:hypothetical protein
MEAVIFIGIQGTGKSSFYLEQFFHTHVRINSDNYIELSGDMLKEAISPSGFRYDLTNGLTEVTIAVRKRFDLASGKVIEQNPFADLP